MIDLNKKAKPNKTIREHTDDLLANLEKLKDFNYIDEKLYELMKITCEYHDYGKINNEFQKRVKSRAKINFDNSKEVAHNVLSLCFLNKENFRVIDEYYKVAYAILNHHHNTKNFEEIRNKKNLIAKFIEDFGGMEIEQRDLKKISLMRANKEAILLKGFLHKCDYSASGNYEIEYRNNFLIDSLNNNFLTNLKKEKSSADWNELQIFCKENSNSNIMIVANTGMGKTEAGLLWIGDNKGFFILPLKTAINAIFDRIQNKIIQNENGNRVAAVVNQFRNIASQSPLELIMGGYRNNQASILERRHDVLMFNQGWQQYGNVINEIVTVGLGYKTALRKALYTFAEGFKNKDFKGAGVSVHETAERHFYRQSELLILDVLANINFSQADEVIADLRDKLHQLCEMLFNQSVAPYAHHPKLISTLALARATLYKHLRELKPQGGPSNG